MAAPRISPVCAEFDPAQFEIGIESGVQTALAATQRGEFDNFIADLSALRRRLFVGRAVPEWLGERGIARAPALLESLDAGGGAMLAQIHCDQYLLIDAPIGDPVAQLFAADTGRDGAVLVLPYEAAEIACGGRDAGELVAELCPADIDAAPADAWSATRIAHCEAAVQRISDPFHYRILCAPADATFLFGVLRDVNSSRDGVMLGLNDYRAWLQRED